MQLILEWLSGGIANAIASSILNPMDVAKTRMQVEKLFNCEAESPGVHRPKIHFSGYILNKNALMRTLINMYKDKGVYGLWAPGLTASIAREFLYSGPRAGFYVPFRDHIHASFGQNIGEVSLMCKILTAMSTGTLGAVIANPVDIVKIRLMVHPEKYTSVFNGILQIYKSEGLCALYKGLMPSTLRGAFIAAGELATYDHAKSVLKSFRIADEGFILHTMASLLTGLVATTVAAPFDIIKTRTMNSHKPESPILILANTIRHEGFFALFRGWMPAYMRLGPHALICFPLLEQIRKAFGLNHI